MKVTGIFILSNLKRAVMPLHEIILNYSKKSKSLGSELISSLLESLSISEINPNYFTRFSKLVSNSFDLILR
jgi:hypothetical protein